MVPFLGDFAEDKTVYIPFNTFSSDDPQASVTITNLANADIAVHKDGGLTQIATDGATVAINFDGITGNHLITVDTSAHADYSTGSDYIVRIEGTTVDGGTINAWIGSFSIENRFMRGTDAAALASAWTATRAGYVDELAAANIPADVDTLLGRIIGTLATGTHNPASAAQIAVLTDWINGGRLDLLLDAIPTTAMRGTDNALLAVSINLTGGAVDTVTTLTNKTGFSLAATGLDAISQAATGMVEIAKAIWDRVLTGATHNIADSAGRRVRDLQEFGTYENGAVWIDTVNGAAGTTDYESGAAFNPVDSIADATTIAASLGLTRFELAPGSSITLAQAYNGYKFDGHGWTLALGGQDVGDSHFFGANVSGIGIGTSEIDFHNCTFNSTGSTLNPFHATDCAFKGTITFGAAGDYIISGHSAIAGATTPIFDTGAAVANVSLIVFNWFNGFELRNLNATGTDLFSISGIGQIIYAASSSGAVNQRGDWKVTNTGGVTITEDDNTSSITVIEVDTADMQPRVVAIEVDTGTTLPALIDDLAIKKNTAGLLHIEMVLTSDHVTPATGLTVTVQRLIDSGAYAGVSGTMTEISNGTYRFDYLAADANGDVITWRFSAATADDTKVAFKTVV